MSTSTSSSTIPASQQSSRKETITEEQKRMYEQLYNEAERESTRGGKFVKFKPNETKILSFVPNGIKHENVTFKENEAPKLMWIFTCYDISNPNDKEVMNQELTWTTGPTNAKRLLRKFKEGYFNLRITRLGSTMQDTEYEIDRLD
jgi:hypothetical protein